MNNFDKVVVICVIIIFTIWVQTTLISLLTDIYLELYAVRLLLEKIVW